MVRGVRGASGACVGCLDLDLSPPGPSLTHDHIQAAIHLPRTELFLQEIGRREPLYFQQRATDEKDLKYADDGYAEVPLLLFV